jgi:hypothetical protein
VGISEVETRNLAEVMSLLKVTYIHPINNTIKVGNKNRAIEATDMNQKSSRSHAILSVAIEVKDRNQGV